MPREQRLTVSTITSATAFVPAVPHLHIAADGSHALTGSRCGACGVVIEGERLACPACAARDSLAPVQLSRHGRIAAHTVVHRSFPGVKTPFVFVVVDLDDGGSVRGTLLDVDPLADIAPEQCVEMVFRDTGQVDPAGKAFLCYYFVPEGGLAR